MRYTVFHVSVSGGKNISQSDRLCYGYFVTSFCQTFYETSAIVQVPYQHSIYFNPKDLGGHRNDLIPKAFS